MDDTPLTLDKPPLYLARVRPSGPRWLPSPFPNSLGLLDGWARARIREHGGHLVKLYLVLASQREERADFIILFESLPRYAVSGDDLDLTRFGRHSEAWGLKIPEGCTDAEKSCSLPTRVPRRGRPAHAHQ
ncbi:MAG TPA: hypothetical protein VFB58_00190, partial [Chloroflexota bacterium]|nr:hypothetical protein [Chloroflexota bacterium]